jgi:hypothetical protein
MIENEFHEEIDPIEELEIQQIFNESRPDLPQVTEMRIEETVRKARHQTGLADYLTLIVRTGKVALYLLEAMFRSNEESASRKE